MAQHCQIHPVPATGTCDKCRAMTCDKCAKVGGTCPYCKMAKIVPPGQSTIRHNDCVNHPMIRGTAVCPDCKRLFCPSCLNPFGQCMDCGMKHPHEHPTVAPEAPKAADKPSRGDARKKKGRKVHKEHLGLHRLVVGALVVAGIASVLKWQYGMLKSTVENAGKHRGGQMSLDQLGKMGQSLRGGGAAGTGGKLTAAQADQQAEELLGDGGGNGGQAEGQDQDVHQDSQQTSDVYSELSKGQEHHPTGQVKLRLGGMGADREPSGGGYRTASRGGHAQRAHVSIYSPRPGSRVHGMTAIGAHVSNDEGVGRVELEVNGQTQDISNQPPFQFSLDTTQLRNGPATLRVVAYDSDGRAQSASSVRVTVAN